MSPIQQRFAKLDLDVGFTKLARKGEFTVSYGPISYYHVKGVPFPFKYLKAWKPDFVRWVEISGQAIAGPHVDHGLTTSLNCYFETGNEVTQFWVPNEGAVPLRYEGAATSNIYRAKDLSPISSFVAQNGDAYLLDVATIHSVLRPDMNTVRRFIQISWAYKRFEEVLAMVNHQPEPRA